MHTAINTELYYSKVVSVSVGSSPSIIFDRVWLVIGYGVNGDDDGVVVAGSCGSCFSLLLLLVAALYW